MRLFTTYKFIAINMLQGLLMLGLVYTWFAQQECENIKLLLGYWLASVCLCYAVLGSLVMRCHDNLTGPLILYMLCPATVFYLVQCVLEIEYLLFTGVAVCITAYRWLLYANALYEERE